MDKPVEKQIKEKFQNMLKHMETDPSVKEEVMDSISKVDTVEDVADLFTSDFIKPEPEMLDERGDS